MTEDLNKIHRFIVEALCAPEMMKEGLGGIKVPLYDALAYIEEILKKGEDL